MKLERITIDPAVCTGKPCIRGLRFPVSRLLGLLASGETAETILAAYPYLEAADIGEALHGLRRVPGRRGDGGGCAVKFLVDMPFRGGNYSEQESVEHLARALKPSPRKTCLTASL